MFATIADIKAAAADKDTSTVPYWFSESTMSFFNTRIIDAVYNMGEFGSLFITADRPDTDMPEGFALRWAHMEDGLFNITTLGVVMDYETLGEAAKAAEHVKKTLPDIVRFTR